MSSTSAPPRLGSHHLIGLRVLPALLVASLLGTSQARAQSSDRPLLFREPALSQSEICFSFGADLWLVPRAGGVARRLTATEESRSGATSGDCSFSPDGRWIAYTHSSSQGSDVYVIASSGGAPRRLTYHPGINRVRGWTPDGRVIFLSGRDSHSPGALETTRLYTQALDRVAPDVIDLPTAWDGSFSGDGKRLVYMPIANANDIWKRYRGGRTTPIWIATLSDASIEKVPRDNSSDTQPMWIGDTVFFLSDRDGATTLYSYELKSKQVRRRIDNPGLDIKNASAGPAAIVYEQFGSIRQYDLATGKNTAIPIRLSGELTAIEPRWVKVGTKLQHPTLSPTGVRAAFEARGEILTVPAKKGDSRDITHTVGVTERFPAWSPDGQTLAYFSDSGGAYHLELRAQEGLKPPRAIKLGEDDSYYYYPVWSPDAKYIAYSDSKAAIWIVNVATGVVKMVDRDPIGSTFGDGGIPVAWSPDSRWLSYARSIENRLDAVFVYDLQKSVFTRVTDGLSDARSPTFDASGKYLYFVASTDAGPASDFSMTTFDHPVTRSLYAIVLDKELPSPMAPESDEERAKGDSSAKSAARAAAGDVQGAKAVKPDTTKDKIAAPKPVRIDFESIDQRTVALPAPPRNYVGLTPAVAGSVILAEAPLIPVDAQSNDATQLTLYDFDLDKRSADQFVAGVTDYDVSRDGKKILYKVQEKWAIGVIATPFNTDSGSLSTADIQVSSDPRAEWREMYHEAFRLQRAFFYDPKYHGLDLGATERFYSRWLDGLGSRDDLDYLFAEAFGNLTVGHLFVDPPPGTDANTPGTGMLGAKYAIENGRWRFAKIYTGESWNPTSRAPLTEPGVNVRAGEYLLAVNGQELTSHDDVDHALEGTAKKSTVLRVGPNANGVGARDVTVVPLSGEAMLRHLAWIDENRRKVNALSGGKLAYIYVPNTSNEGYARFNRYFFAQQDKSGAVVDERFNGGGNIADYMIDYLNRGAPFNYMTTRNGVDVPVPAGAIYGPKVLLINEYAGSGGDELPWLFHRLKAGKIVGKRTWGGLVGIGGYPSLMDGGSVTAPRAGLWSADGDYAVENKGVSPDVEVDLEPAAWRAGHDTQLERAVAMLMEELAKPQPAKVKRPNFPTPARTPVDSSSSH